MTAKEENNEDDTAHAVLMPDMLEKDYMVKGCLEGSTLSIEAPARHCQLFLHGLLHNHQRGLTIPSNPNPTPWLQLKRSTNQCTSVRTAHHGYG